VFSLTVRKEIKLPQKNKIDREYLNQSSQETFTGAEVVCGLCNKRIFTYEKSGKLQHFNKVVNYHESCSQKLVIDELETRGGWNNDE